LPTEVSIVMRSDAPGCVACADPTRVQQILMNLVSNAKDACSSGGQITITLSCAPPLTGAETSPEGPVEWPWVRIEVADTGCGIPPENLGRVFDPFFTTKAPGQGTGLGLSQVFGLVTQHEGRTSIESSEAGGTAVTITLPAGASSAKVDPVGRPHVPRGSGERLLVVDDDPAVRGALGETLGSLGYRVTLAADGEEAVAFLEGNSSDMSLVLSDVLMPGMGGESLARVMAERWPSLPIILVSGSPLVGSISRFALAADRTERGPVRLAKPFSSNELAETLRAVLRTPA
jgi:two-component system cell cycle sensor histidine kinase/response regulator CckA